MNLLWSMTRRTHITRRQIPNLADKAWHDWWRKRIRQQDRWMKREALFALFSIPHRWRMHFNSCRYEWKSRFCIILAAPKSELYGKCFKCMRQLAESSGRCSNKFFPFVHIFCHALKWETKGQRLWDYESESLGDNQKWFDTIDGKGRKWSPSIKGLGKARRGKALCDSTSDVCYCNTNCNALIAKGCWSRIALLQSRTSVKKRKTLIWRKTCVSCTLLRFGNFFELHFFFLNRQKQPWNAHWPNSQKGISMTAYKLTFNL